jgi:hypothetical protein
MGTAPSGYQAGVSGTSHVSIVDRAEWLVPMVMEFLDGSMPEAK